MMEIQDYRDRHEAARVGDFASKKSNFRNRNRRLHGTVNYSHNRWQKTCSADDISYGCGAIEWLRKPH